MKKHFFILFAPLVISFFGCEKLTDEERFEKDVCKIHWTNLGGGGEVLSFYRDNKLQFNFHSSRVADWSYYKQDGYGKLRVSLDSYTMWIWDNEPGWDTAQYEFNNLIFGYIYRNNPVTFTVQEFVGGDDENAYQKIKSGENAKLFISTDQLAFLLNYSSLEPKKNNKNYN